MRVSCRTGRYFDNGGVLRVSSVSSRRYGARLSQQIPAPVAEGAPVRLRLRRILIELVRWAIEVLQRY
jgi:hypothetical protein